MRRRLTSLFCERLRFCHSETVTDALSWESVSFYYQGEYGLPHQCEHWFAMTM